MTFSRFLVGLIGIPLGFFILVYRVRIKDFVGRLDFFEQHFGPGGTWTAIALLGIVTSVFSFFWMLGTIQAIFLNTLGRFFFPLS